jgi:hypothetical protein
MLRDGLAHPVSWVPLPDPHSEEAIVDRILAIIEAIDRGARPQPFGTGWQLIVEEGPHAGGPHAGGRPAFAIETIEDEPADSWLRKLNQVVDYFPVIRDTPLPGSRGPVNYQLMIKLPGFTDPVVPVSDTRDCGCPPTPGGDNLCYAAWIGRAPFRTAWDAWNAWVDLLPALADDRNYRPVFTKEIGQYEIILQERKTLVACNPQRYPYAQFDIGAMERATARINAEGMHLVEHLLLRNARGYAPIPVCTSNDPCASVWAQSATDPTGTNFMEFQAGADPYSFILTVALPAWPARFRTPANRALLESIIQRETPAHILPRILWLTPRDMCRFEHFYRGWVDHLRRLAEDHHSDHHHADHHHAGGHHSDHHHSGGHPSDHRQFCGLFDEAAFIRFLFEVGSIGPILGSPCEPQHHQDHNPIWLNEINDLYCWASPVDTRKEPEAAFIEDPAIEAAFIEDPHIGATPIEEFAALVVEEAKAAFIEELAIEVSLIEEPPIETLPVEEPPIEKSKKFLAEEPPIEEPQSPPPVLSPKELRDIRRVQRARHTRYAKAIQAWQKAPGAELLVSKSEAFLLDPDPSLRRLEELLTEINETEQKVPAIRTKRPKSPHLAATVLAIFLDRIIEKPVTRQTLEQLGAALRHSGHRIGQPDEFYTTWRPEELRPLTSQLTLSLLYKILKETIHYKP